MCTGFLFTTLVQSSSAVTVAVIGFVNAGLVTLSQSVGVIYGSNIGTTITGWIVAAVGVSVKVKALALPMVGLGAILRLTGANTRREHLGDALAGFGIFFLGIEVLQSTFTGLQSQVNLAAFAGNGPLFIMLFALVGFGLTLLMQSSSAAIALVLTAAMSGFLDLSLAAATVVGANIGTTSTAAFSVIGATHNAKKVAAAQILFNLGTGAIALLIMPLFLKGVAELAHVAHNDDPATILALFHTCFNLLGVALFLPFTERLVRFLNRRIGSKIAEIGTPRYLDRNVVKSPVLALDALFMELGRLGEQTRLMTQKALASDFRSRELIRMKAGLENLIMGIREFCAKLQRADLPESVAKGMPESLRVVQYYNTVIDTIFEVSQEHATLRHDLPPITAEHALNFRKAVREILDVAHTPCAPEFHNLKQQLHELGDVYHELKKALLQAGANGSISLSRMVELLDFYSRLRRVTSQAIKGSIHWAGLRDLTETCRFNGTDNAPSWKPGE
ncbi:Na/Pi cotransporter family protein [Pseudodesulfovibrio tunisiensis]|uniref:Na/Pi cotransporter family protein n=1 Tax=Pseudodesulfovibrio tunisiensis TaxID=463192 RepID=UPI001FB2B95C|nr:Na/Pi symporter [Pseudodesulfovibrio tunisiensis]